MARPWRRDWRKIGEAAPKWPARYFLTYTGKHVHSLSPHPEEIDIDDVAHSLSQMCRFLGHTDGFYSVGQHSVLVSELVPAQDALWGLLHDASEAYLCDLPAPIKRDPEMGIYRIAEDRLMLRGLPEIRPAAGNAQVGDAGG